jgi:hypothetical protein
MGTTCALTYANLFLADFEVLALEEMKNIILFYKCFIDDIFAIVKGNLNDVLAFQKHFGNLHLKMKIEWNYSQYHLPFLNVDIALEHTPGIPIQAHYLEVVTCVFQKALNAYLYIPWLSCHSDDSKCAWVKNELIRYVRICLKETDFAKICKEFAI